VFVRPYGQVKFWPFGVGDNSIFPAPDFGPRADEGGISENLVSACVLHGGKSPMNKIFMNCPEMTRSDIC